MVMYYNDTYVKFDHTARLEWRDGHWALHIGDITLDGILDSELVELNPKVVEAPVEQFKPGQVVRYKTNSIIENRYALGEKGFIALDESPPKYWKYGTGAGDLVNFNSKFYELV